jgi:hypothetical protein
MITPFDASTPAEPAVVALFDQISGELGAMVDRARADLAEGWNRVQLVDVLAAQLYEIGQQEPVGQASLFAAAIVQLAQCQPAPTTSEE